MSKILIIDDEKSIRNTLKDILSYENYQVSLAENGMEAIKMVGANEFDVILCDIKMPEMDGLEVLEKLQEIAFDVPVIMIRDMEILIRR